ncbi:CCNG2 family protein [Megaselia abdita]
MSVPVRIIAAAEYTANSGLRIVANKGTVEDHLYSQHIENQVQQYSGGKLEYQQQFLKNRPSTSAMAMMADQAAAIGSCNDVTMEQPMSTEWRTMQQQQYSRDVDMDGVRLGESIGAAGLEYQKHQQQHHGNQRQQFLDPSEKNIDNGNGLGLTDNNITINKIEQEILLCNSDELFQRLNEYDALQDKYHTMLDLPKESRREVTAGGRDGSAYVLRCLKMWYELPSDVLFAAINLVDRFLGKMSVKPKHMACMSVASFHLAIKQLDYKPIPSEDLVTISQCGCTAGDLERMAGVIANKLGVQIGHPPVTSLSFLRIYYGLFRNMAKELGGHLLEFYEKFIKLEELEMRLEVLLCDVQTTAVSSSTLALVLICLHLDFHIKESYPFKEAEGTELKHLFEYILYLQQLSKIPDRLFTNGFSIVSGLLSHYNGQNKQPYKQRLVWKLSSRTLRILRPTNRFSTDLTTIEEGYPHLDDALRSR